jgi:hypothetical protein
MWLFKLRLEEKYRLELSNYQDLYKWSVEHIADFWREVAIFTGIHASPVKEGQNIKRRKLNHVENDVNDLQTGPASEELFNEVSGRISLSGTRDSYSYLLPYIGSSWNSSAISLFFTVFFGGTCRCVNLPFHNTLSFLEQVSTTCTFCNIIKIRCLLRQLVLSISQSS